MQNFQTFLDIIETTALFCIFVEQPKTQMKTLLLDIIASAATPWFLSWWFLTCISALLILSVIIVQSRRKQNELTIALKEQEQRLYEEKVALLINMSHELRTPLTLIMAPLKRMLAGIGPEHPDYNTLNRIYRQSRRMKDLLNMALEAIG